MYTVRGNQQLGMSFNRTFGCDEIASSTHVLDTVVDGDRKEAAVVNTVASLQMRAQRTARIPKQKGALRGYQRRLRVITNRPVCASKDAEHFY